MKSLVESILNENQKCPVSEKDLMKIFVTNTKDNKEVKGNARKAFKILKGMVFSLWEDSLDDEFTDFWGFFDDNDFVENYIDLLDEEGIEIDEKILDQIGKDILNFKK